MTVIADTPAAVPGGSSNAADHLWMHFTRMGGFAADPVPIVERGEGAYIYDSNGRRYLDALSGLFVVQAGYGRGEIADAAEQLPAADVAFLVLVIRFASGPAEPVLGEGDGVADELVGFV